MTTLRESHATHSDTGGPRTGSPAVDLRGLVKTFHLRGGDAVRAVDGLDPRIEHGEVVAFLGPNRAGKTTTLDLVLGLTEPTEGNVEVFGARPREAVRAGRVSAVLQSGGLLGGLTVRETVVVVASATCSCRCREPCWRSRGSHRSTATSPWPGIR